MEKIVYSIIIPVKPEKDQPHDYNAGPLAGDIRKHYVFYNEHKKVFWSWGLSNAGIKQEHKKHLTSLFANLGEFSEINGTQVKVDNIGYFYSSESKSICYKFNIDSFKLQKQQISEDEIQYIPPFRKENHYDVDSWKGSWMLINHLDNLGKVEDSISGTKVGNCYEFPDFPYQFYSNPKKSIVNFNTNHLTQGNAFVMKI